MDSTRPPSFSVSHSDAQHRLLGDRVGYREPWLDLLALPAALVLALLVTASGFGRMLTVPLQIQFHELGHASVAWLSSRAALPLPFGFTFWSEQRSTFTALCVLFLLGLLIVHAYQERRPFGLLLGLALLVFWLKLSCVMSSERSMMWVIAGGVAGEFVLTSIAIVAFSYPMPDRLRWDFFRLLLMPAAVFAWVGSARLWIGVARGTEAMPLGTIFGSVGDMSGDLDRLIADHGFTQASLTRVYVGLCLASALVWLVNYALFARRAVAELRARPQ